MDSLPCMDSYYRVVGTLVCHSQVASRERFCWLDCVEANTTQRPACCWRDERHQRNYVLATTYCGTHESDITSAQHKQGSW